MATLKLYLTSLEPDMAQTIYSQSIGGYFSNSLVYPETTLVSSVGLYSTSISLETPLVGNWLDWEGDEYINIGNELIKVNPITEGSLEVIQRGANNIVNMHIEGDIVRASSKELFNDVLNDSYKQYRCIALKNDSTSDSDPSNELVAYDVSVYIKQNSRSDNSAIEIALEKPSNTYITSTSSSWNSMQLTDISLIGLYEDNHFKESYLKILSGDAIGQGKIVSSFDSSTGTFTFFNSFSSLFDFSVVVDYEVLPSPAQRIKTGTVIPDTSSENVTQFFTPDENTGLSFFDEDVSSFNISDLSPKDVVYIWIEREVKKGSKAFSNNDFVLNVRYKVRE